MNAQRAETIWPALAESDFNFRCRSRDRHGRNSEKLRHLAEHLYLVDINFENIEVLRNRFQNALNITHVHNHDIDLSAISGDAAMFICPFNSMDHFDSDIVRSIWLRVRRMLRVGGRLLRLFQLHR